MKQITLVKEGDAASAFEMREVTTPNPGHNEVLVKVAHFGLNYADVMARKGLYNDRPNIPCVLGYEVVGKIESLGEGVKEFSVGDLVLGFTKFNGYASHCIVPVLGLVRLSLGTNPAEATALATQYCTAWYGAKHLVRLLEGDKVLVHAAAGGVGTALVQIAKNAGCTVFGTAGSDEKLEYLRSIGVDHAINYRSQDFVKEIDRILGDDRLDVAFDPIGGANFKQSFSLLGSGGRIVAFGASSWSDTNGGFIDKLKLAFGFGFFHPILLLMKSKSMLGLNMLRIAENKPKLLQLIMQEVYAEYQKGALKPHVGGSFPVEQVAEAHAFLEKRKSIGKISVYWPD